jgi:predicted transposase/invertase (TIGR01784 family)
MEAYRSSELRYEDLYNFTSYAKQEGKIEGIIEGERRGISFRNHEIAQNMLNLNMSINDIVKVTGLVVEDILKIKQS